MIASHLMKVTKNHRVSTAVIFSFGARCEIEHISSDAGSGVTDATRVI